MWISIFHLNEMNKKECSDLQKNHILEAQKTKTQKYACNVVHEFPYATARLNDN